MLYYFYCIYLLKFQYLSYNIKIEEYFSPIWKMYNFQHHIILRVVNHAKNQMFAPFCTSVKSKNEFSTIFIQ